LPAKPFFRATEVWTPTADRQNLDLTAGVYHDMPYFEAVSRGMRLGRDQGLPGKAWTSGHPIVLKELTGSYFMRGDAAANDGLSCAVALPIFGGEELTSVIVFFFGDNRYQRGALEVWSTRDDADQMALVDGYYGRADQFGSASRDTRFARGAGLPGKVWDEGLPFLVAEVADSDTFQRRDTAEQFTIRRAIGIPCSSGSAGDWAMTFLSVRSAPIAQRFEVWLADEASGAFTFAQGYCETVGSLDEGHTGHELPLAAGIFADARRTGIPAICTSIGTMDDPTVQAAAAIGLSNLVALPVFARGRFKAILAWYS
jgi:hypothetical protein